MRVLPVVRHSCPRDNSIREGVVYRPGLFVANSEAVHHAVGKDGVKGHFTEGVMPAGYCRLQRLLKSRTDWIGGIAYIAARGWCFHSGEAGCSGDVDVERGRAHKDDAELRWEGPVATGARNVASEAEAGGKGRLIGMQADDSAAAYRICLR